jgi:hypothetical protein
MDDAIAQVAEDAISDGSSVEVLTKMASKFAKRHYEVIADVMRDTALMLDEEDMSTPYPNGPFVWNVVLENMVEAFKCDNPRFSESRFEEACKKGTVLA